MSEAFDPGWLPLMHGSVPYGSPQEAWNLVLTYFPEIPTWPQLVQRSYLEGPYIQFSERFPGAVLENQRVHVARSNRMEVALDRLYLAYLQGDIDHGAISPDHAAGLAMLMEDAVPFMQPMEAIKGQVTGPISWGLDIVDRRRRPILYDEILAEAVVHHIYLKAAWQERELRRINPNTIIFLNEPNLTSFSSAAAAISREQVISLLNQVLAGISGLSGIHCCGETDWSILFSTEADIVNINAYDHAGSLAECGEYVHAFLQRGGIIGGAPSGDGDRGEPARPAERYDEPAGGAGGVKGGHAKDRFYHADLWSRLALARTWGARVLPDGGRFLRHAA